jgi:hypothetical protein
VLLHPFSYPEERRFAVAEPHGHVVGFAAAFKEKVRPRAWEPVYLAVPPDERPVLEMNDVLHAFAPGGLAWVLFDAGLCEVLLTQARRWPRGEHASSAVRGDACSK